MSLYLLDSEGPPAVATHTLCSGPENPELVSELVRGGARKVRVRRIGVLGLLHRRLSPGSASHLCRRLAAMLAHGTVLPEALRRLACACDSDTEHRVLTFLESHLRRGRTLREVLPVITPLLPGPMAATARWSEGTEQDVAAGLSMIADELDETGRLWTRVVGALVVPGSAYLLLVAGLVAAHGTLLPVLRSVLSEGSGEPQALAWLSRMLPAVWAALVVPVAVLLVSGFWARSAVMLRGSLPPWMERVTERTPLLGRCIREREHRLLLVELRTALRAGRPVEHGLRTYARRTVLASRSVRARQLAIFCEQGRPFMQGLAHSGLIDSPGQLDLALALESNEPMEELSRLVSTIAEETGYRLELLVRLLEPAAAVLVGLIVAVVAVIIVGAVVSAYGQLLP